MANIGRNQPCPCGSGKKYKRCHGALGQTPPSRNPLPEAMARLNLELQRHEASELQRRLMQGLGRPIISFESQGHRIVAVGKQIFWSKTWLTFTDFLLYYVKAVMTLAWGQKELAKPTSEHHPLIEWTRRVGEFLKTNTSTRIGKIYEAPMTGVVRAYLGLAYDLYLAAHNATLPELLLKRLRNAKTFEGALYEAYVIGTFAKAGFTIAFEDEGDPTSSHCEFTATHQITGKKFSVEAKAISSASSRAGATANPPRIRNLLYGALRKAASYPRIIFIELNRTQTRLPNGDPDWATAVDKDLADAAAQLTIDGGPTPPAYVFITNRAYMQAFDLPDAGEAGIAHGFKIPEFPQGRGCRSFLEAVNARERHLEPHLLLKAMNTRAEIPSTFDSRTPEEVFSAHDQPRLRFGDTHMVPDGTGKDVPGVLSEGVVIEPQKVAYCIYQLSNGQHVTVTVPLTDRELAIYRRSPETFFGVIKHVGKGIKEPMDAYDFMFGSYSKTPKERLLEFMAGWPEFAELNVLTQEELAKHYSARIAERVWAEHVARTKAPSK